MLSGFRENGRHKEGGMKKLVGGWQWLCSLYTKRKHCKLDLWLALCMLRCPGESVLVSATLKYIRNKLDW